MTLPTNWVDGNTVHASDLDAISTAVNANTAVSNSDGTLSVNGLNASQPLSTVSIVTTSNPPAIGQTTYYNAASGNLTPSLPALSGLRVGASLSVRRDPADVSQNTVTLSCAGSDTFYSSGSTSTAFPVIGEQRAFQVISVSGTKYWSPAGAINPIAALDNRYLTTAKLVNIADNSWGVGMTSGFATSTSGTSEQPYTIGLASSGIAVAWNHFYDGATDLDTDPTGAISFNASLRVISSSNSSVNLNTIYRITFTGRTTATLDPGGRIVSDLLGISLNPGDIVAVRTFLSSGTAYPYHQSLGGAYSVYGAAYGGFTATTDLTAPGSAAVTNSQSYVYGPSAILGYPVGSGTAKSVLLLGDSIACATGEAGIGFTKPILAPGGFAIRALTGQAGLLNLAEGGDSATSFLTSSGSFRRLKNVDRCNSAIIEYGANDLAVYSITASALEALNLTLAAVIRRMGIAKVFVTTLIPRTTSTDGFATTTNQTPISTESQRLLYNAWVRANCPVNSTTLAPVAVGTSGALHAGQLGHPFTGFFDTAATVESSLNSGFWLPCNRVVNDAAMTSGQSTITSATANFVNTAQEVGGDIGSSFVIFGAGASGANIGTAATPLAIQSVQSATQCTVDGTAGTTVSGAQLNIGVMTYEGTHPSSHAHYLMSQAINVAYL